MTAARGVFISYRRQDAAFPAGWLYEQLVNRFGEPHVFKDVDSIRPGQDFVNVIKTAVRSCHTLLVVIGPKWLSIADKRGGRRIDDPDDFIRLEIETAIAYDVQIIPVLVLDAEMPSADALPPPIEALARRNAIQISSNRFQADLGRLIRAVEDEWNTREGLTRSDLQFTPRAQPPAGLVGGRYQLAGVLGYGGMSEVHRARDIQLGRDVAVKMLRADLARDPRFPLQLRREAEVAAALRHPTIVAVYDAGEFRTQVGLLPYIVMELVDGQTLRELLKNTGPMAQERAVEVVADVCAALDLGHRHRVVHGDIQPSNIMINRAGAVKVLNFGVAAALGQGDSGVGPSAERVRRDVYAAGCVLYELLTGRPPYPGSTTVDPSALNSAVSPSLDTIVRRALFADPANGYDSAAALRADLLRLRREGHSTAATVPAIGSRYDDRIAPPTPPPALPSPPSGPHPAAGHGRERGFGRILAMSLAVLVAVALVVVVGRWLLARDASVPQAPVDSEVTATAPVTVSVAAPPPPQPSPTNRSPQKVIVPNVSGLDVDVATKQLIAGGFDVGVEEVESNERSGTVTGCEPPAGTSVVAGSRVILKVVASQSPTGPSATPAAPSPPGPVTSPAPPGAG
jgi:protein kinase-like protein/TIR domain-containing protein/PASTA domain-containing protein